MSNSKLEALVKAFIAERLDKPRLYGQLFLRFGEDSGRITLNIEREHANGSIICKAAEHLDMERPLVFFMAEISSSNAEMVASKVVEALEAKLG